MLSPKSGIISYPIWGFEFKLYDVKSAMEFQLERTRIDKIPRSKIDAELERASVHFEYIEFTKRQFDEFAEISTNTVVREYGSRSKAISSLRETLKAKGKVLHVRRKGHFSDNDLFEEMGRVWEALGHRPSRIEWEDYDSRISYQTYKRYFGGWENACLRFIEFKMGSEIVVSDDAQGTEAKAPEMPKTKVPSRRRDAPLKLRLSVLKRDNFRCVFCGKSPATNLGVVLHIDHIVPFSKGGETKLNNLQTLCEQCNLGKSDTYVV